MATNWGRWGERDERGALNLIDEAVVRRALSAARRGRTVSLGLPLTSGGGPVAGFRSPMQHFMSRDGGDYAAGLAEKPGYGYADDTIIVACHGTTHLDALSHVWRDGLMWNGIPASTVTSRGASRCGVEAVGPVVTRTLFLDLGAELRLDDAQPIGPDELDTALRRRGLAAQPGDALLVRTGWLARWRTGNATTQSWPGLSADTAQWLADRDVAVIGADNIAVEVGPSGVPGAAMPLHVAAMRDLGVYFLELLDLEALAAADATEAMLVVAPLNIVGGVGSPVAPVVVY